jgi:hypothetical protein
MANDNLASGIFALSSLILAVSAFNVLNRRENFTETEVDKYSSGPSLQDAQNLENYQNSVVMNIGTSPDQVNHMGAQYYANLQNYLNPSMDNLQLAQNISSREIMGGVNLPGASSSYTNVQGAGYVDNLGYLKGSAFPPVSYSNDRAAQLSKCATDLPMFAASSLLPKPSANADNNALSQSAARALAAYTALSPVEQIGAITSINTPYSKTSDIRALDQIPQSSMQTALFNSSPSTYISPTYGQVNNNTDRPGPSGYTNVAYQ